MGGGGGGMLPGLGGVDSKVSVGCRKKDGLECRYTARYSVDLL